VLGGDVIAFSPPLIITEAEIDVLVDTIGIALDETLAWTRR
jgi:adenosylmethionine-8-amino-7-oxononanoate aminotransferase